MSAIVGVACWKLLHPWPWLAAAVAVATAIALMHATRTLHPPGGATALAAVIGGAAVHDLGYRYALSPIALNCAIILVVGFVFNYAFPWRRYPASLMRYRGATVRSGSLWPRISEEHVIEAMGDGRGAVMIDGKMEDDASVKQCHVMVDLAHELADRDPELAALYGFA